MDKLLLPAGMGPQEPTLQIPSGPNVVKKWAAFAQPTSHGPGSPLNLLLITNLSSLRRHLFADVA